MHIIIMNIPKHFVDILPFQYKVFYRSVVRMDRSLVWFPNWKPENVCQQYIYIYYAKSQRLLYNLYANCVRCVSIGMQTTFVLGHWDWNWSVGIGFGKLYKMPDKAQPLPLHCPWKLKVMPVFS